VFFAVKNLCVRRLARLAADQIQWKTKLDRFISRKNAMTTMMEKPMDSRMKNRMSF
jgi:hypothetical protein